MKEEVKRWITSGKRDLKKARDNFKIGNYDLTSFLCQQAVEKILKAILIEKTNSFPKIHDLVRLGKLASIKEDLLKDCERLTFVYTETRYPDTSTRKYNKKESEEDLRIAGKIIKWTAKNLL